MSNNKLLSLPSSYKLNFVFRHAFYYFSHCSDSFFLEIQSLTGVQEIKNISPKEWKHIDEIGSNCRHILRKPHVFMSAV